ncbi:protein longifolia 1 [Phtheirospermum japonicum]|uniref:Protein longifolia 1 n=1 Tax=Phtheirospermum japonicum TaxID=374723 RepID=A0A830C8V1_9LAMI|nr:protein longifolia 1 [Phtheirospermum japonicum]
MAAKLLHSLTDENPDLQKQIGCMTGIFQLFDRQPILTGGGRRVLGHGSKRIIPGNPHFHSLERESNNTHLRSASTEKYSHKNIQEKQRISTESSRPSFSSSSRSSSFSSLDCNRAAHLEPASYDRIIFPETPSRDPAMSLHSSSSPQFSRQSLDIRDLVKDSMYREVHALSIKPKSTTDSPRPHSKNNADLKGSLKALAFYQNEPRELLRSASYHAKEGSNPFSVTRDAPRFSYDGRETRALKLKDVPRLSLDSRESSMRGCSKSTFEFDAKAQQTRPPSVVAKLMGLEMLPDSVSSSNDANSVSGRSYIPDEDFINNIPSPSAKMGRNSPLWGNSESLKKKPVLRFPIEPAPWKQIDGKPTGRAPRGPAKGSGTFPSVYSEIEKRLKDLEFTQSGKDLRALKQILEAMQSKGFLETEGKCPDQSVNNNNEKARPDQVLDSTKRRIGSARQNYESPIVIMKPAKLVEKSGRNDRTPKTTVTSSRLVKDGNGGPVKSSGSISPRMQQKRIELEKRSRPPTPPDSSKSRRQPNKQQQTESNSPGGRRRPKQTSEVSVESRYLNHRENESSVQSSESNIRSSKSAKSTQGLNEDESAELGFVPPEYSSPVSVLDKAVCKDDSPSPVKYVGKTLKADISIDKERDPTEPGSTSEISRKKLQNIDNLVQKLRRLNSTHDEARNDYIASLCENTNPDHRYVSEILLASGLLLRDLGSSLTNFQFHPSGHPINPELFLVLEQTKSTQLMTEGKFHRKLIFDTVNEILARKLASSGPFSELWVGPVKIGKRAMNAQKLLRELCSEIELLQAKKPKCGPDEEEDDEWKDILWEDVMRQPDSWKSFDGEISGAVLDIERSIFKDLVNEIVIGESAGLRTKPGRRRLFVK